MKTFLWLLVIVLILGGLYWMSQSKVDAPVAPAPEAALSNALTPGDQKAGSELSLGSVSVGQDASVVIHKEQKGGPGAVIGTASVKKGTYQNLSVTLSEPVKSGDNIYPMLHPDTNGDGSYESAEEGTPLNDAAGNPVIVKVTISK